MSDDFGQTWKNIGNAIPIASVNVIKEDPVNKNMLYVGTDNGLYVSFNKGNSWEVFSRNLPNVAVHDFSDSAYSKTFNYWHSWTKFIQSKHCSFTIAYG